MQVPPYFLDSKYGETIEAQIKIKVLTRILFAALIRDGCHWLRN